jgi:hypothetical protein
VQRWIYHFSILPKFSHLFRHLWIEPFFTIIQIIPKSIMDNMDNLGSTITISWGYLSILSPINLYCHQYFCQIFAMEHPTNPPRLGGADPAQAMVILVRMTQCFFWWDSFRCCCFGYVNYMVICGEHCNIL